MGFEPTTFCLASRRSTTELRPPLFQISPDLNYQKDKVLSISDLNTVPYPQGIITR